MRGAKAGAKMPASERPGIVNPIRKKGDIARLGGRERTGAPGIPPARLWVTPYSAVSAATEAPGMAARY